MLDPNYIRQHEKEVTQAAKDKGVDVDVHRFIRVDKKRRILIHESEHMRAEQNAANSGIAKATGARKKTAIARMKKVATAVKETEDQLRAVQEEWRELLLTMPNIPAKHVPRGKDESGNIVLRAEGAVPTFSFKPKSHIELGHDLDIIDFERGVKLAGNRGYVLKGSAARLEMALMQYAIDFLTKKEYIFMMPPTIVKGEFLEGSGHFPWGREEVYKAVDRENESFLVGTSEVPVTGYHAGETLEAESLPRRYSAFSTCYRTELGSYGKDTKGLYRLRQFNKVEQVILCAASEKESQKMFTEILTNAEQFLQSLELPYRVTQICTGDMGAKGVDVVDVEAWMPSRESYGETHTCSRFGDFQARRLNIKYTDADGKKQFVHTLNNTLIASPRILIPLLEIHQQKDGSIKIPQALHPYMGRLKRIE